MNKQPFTEQEESVMDLLIKAHKEFIALERMHPMEVQEWVHAFHKLQDILFYRVVKRDYKDYFNEHKK